MKTLREVIAEAAQGEFEDSITTSGQIAHSEFLGDRIAAAVLEALEERQITVHGVGILLRPDSAAPPMTPAAMLRHRARS